MKTHFAAVRKNEVVGYRSSTSRHAEGVGRFGLYTHAVYITTMTVKTTLADGSEQTSHGAAVTTWHGGLKNGQAGLRQVNMSSTYEYNGIRTVTTVKSRELVPVVVLPKRPKIGQPVEATHLQQGLCPGCSGRGAQLTDDPQVLKCQGCGGVFNPWQEPITYEAALKFVALNQDMLANAGPDGQFYFDLTIYDVILADGKTTNRIHGWADTKTRRVVQFG